MGSDCAHNVAVQFEPQEDASGRITSVAVICCICREQVNKSMVSYFLDEGLIAPAAPTARWVALPTSMFFCEECGITYAKGWSDEESQVELNENFPGLTKVNAACVCDDCYRKCMGLAPLAEVS